MSLTTGSDNEEKVSMQQLKSVLQSFGEDMMAQVRRTQSDLISRNVGHPPKLVPLDQADFSRPPPMLPPSMIRRDVIPATASPKLRFDIRRDVIPATASPKLRFDIIGTRHILKCFPRPHQPLKRLGRINLPIMGSV
jgi:hypothetical protein